MVKPVLSLFKRKWFWFTIAIFLVIVPLFLAIGLHDGGRFSTLIINASDALNQHKTPVLLWHILLILAIWWIWGAKVRRDAKKYTLKPASIKRALRFRYWMIAVVVVIDLLVFLR